MIGTTVSHYRIFEQLGSGGMGVVYKAEDTRLKRTVALKFLPPTLITDPEAKQRFVHEAQAASALDHPNICTVHDVVDTPDGQTFIVMACYEGESLKSKIEDGELKIEDGIETAVQIAEGLTRAHEAGIVHRDIKPANIFITTHNEVKILDFGLAKLTGQTVLTKTGSTLGTAAYMSPEQARGDAVDHRTDIWSIGVILYEMLTGRRPFESSYDQALVYMILNEEPTRIRSIHPEVPEVLEQIVQKALTKNPDERYQKAEDFLADLKTATKAPEEQAGVTLASAEASRRRKKGSVRILIAAGAACLVLGALFLIVLPLFQDQAIASNPRAIAFISFENKTGDESLAYLRNVLPDVLGTSLGESKYFRVTRSDRMREMMKQVGKDSVEYIDRQTGLLLCRRAGINVMGVGTFTKAGSIFLTELELMDVGTGELLGSSMKARGREVESFLKEDGIVDELAKQISRAMGVSSLRTQVSLKPVAEVSSTSMEAQRYYQRGKSDLDKRNFKDARMFLEMAVKEDSTFAIAWYWLSQTCRHLRDGTAGVVAMDKAVKNAARATERDQFVIAIEDSTLRVPLLKAKGREGTEVDYLSFVKARAEIFPFDPEFHIGYASTLYLTEATNEYEKVVQLDHAYPEVYNNLGYCYAGLGQADKSIRALERYAELQPGDPNPFHSMGECLLALRKYDEAILKCEQALRVKPDFFLAAQTMAKLYFMKEEYEEAILWADRGLEIAPSSSLRADFLWWRAWYLVWAGRLKEAEAALQRSEKAASPEFDKDLLDRISWLRAWPAFEQRNWAEARRYLTSRPKESGIQGMFWDFCLGFLDLQQGMADSVEFRVQMMEKAFLSLSRKVPRNTQFFEATRLYYRNALESAWLLNAHRPEQIQWKNCLPGRAMQRGTQELPPTACWPIIWERGSVSYTVWMPLPFDIVPQAYVDRGLIDSAIVVFEQAMKKPPDASGPIVARYYCRLGRLYEQKGMNEKAIENYTQFLKVWGKADPVYKEPADARRRLARLKKSMVKP